MWIANRVDVLGLAAVALTAVAFFAWTAHTYFLSDDFILLVQAHAPWSWRGILATRGGDGSFRPAGILSYVISAKWAGSDPAAWHWIGFVLHAATALLVYALTAALGFSRFAAWLGATVFALHGSHPEAVVWIAGRFDLLSTLFFLAAAVTFVLSWRAGGGRRMLYECAAVVSMAVAMLTKESAYSFPLVAALLVACFSGVRDRRAWRLVAVLFGVTLMLFAYRWSLLGGIGGYGGVSFAPSLKALALRMWAVLFFPVNWAIRPGAALIAVAVAYVAGLARLFMVRAEISKLAFAAGFALMTAAPALSQLLIGLDLEKARVLYLPSVGLCLLVAALCERLQARDRMVVAAALVLFHGMVLWHNLRGWERASEVVQAACAAAARCANGSGHPVVVTGLPRTLDGVYTFANGFQECVAMQGGGIPNAKAADGGECRFVWDKDKQALRGVQ